MTELRSPNTEPTALRRRNENPSIDRALQNDIMILSNTDSIWGIGERKQEIFRVVVDHQTHLSYSVDALKASDL